VPARHRVLVVEDDPDIRELLVQVVRPLDVEVFEAASGEEALELVRSEDPDLVTLDLGLPGLDGMETCRRLRGFSDAYVVMITGRDDEVDQLVGLEVGADDYLAKPISPREVRARVAALLRRPRAGLAARGASEAEPPPSSGGLVVDPVAQRVTLHGEPLTLTPVEIDVLAALVARPGHTWDRGELVRQVWRGEFVESDYLVDVQVGSLRRKLRAHGADGLIRTVGGTGYRFDPGG
jgi:DNA-binding response OmpR family regulator